LQTVGTPLYIAPEVILQRYGVGADVWSAGILVSTSRASSFSLSLLLLALFAPSIGIECL
jgi:serine/threonine protein kinase